MSEGRTSSTPNERQREILILEDELEDELHSSGLL